MQYLAEPKRIDPDRPLRFPFTQFALVTAAGACGMWKDDFSSIARQQEAKKMQAGCAFRGRDLIFLFIAKGKLSTQAQGSGRMLRWEISLSIALGPVILSLFSVRASHRICIESSFLVPGKMFVTSRSALISIFGHVLQGSIGVCVCEFCSAQN